MRRRRLPWSIQSEEKAANNEDGIPWRASRLNGRLVVGATGKGIHSMPSTLTAPTWRSSRETRKAEERDASEFIGYMSQEEEAAWETDAFGS
jgi:hypothetical protein